ELLNRFNETTRSPEVDAISFWLRLHKRIRVSIKMPHPNAVKDAVQIQLSYHLLREAGWQSGH
ncbi:MAG TPA: hypothetical protein DCL32_07170, partial [Gammaproteobacteria bacterium]|nr:hypothetical protein [Gammaproteobacteria bacterium]